MALAPQAALVDSIIGCRRGLLHALGALAERDECTLVLLIRARLRASWWHLPQCLWRPVLALWCVYQSACKVASYLVGAKSWVLRVLQTRVGAHGARPGEGRGRAFSAKTPPCDLDDACRKTRKVTLTCGSGSSPQSP